MTNWAQILDKFVILRIVGYTKWRYWSVTTTESFEQLPEHIRLTGMLFKLVYDVYRLIWYVYSSMFSYWSKPIGLQPKKQQPGITLTACDKKTFWRHRSEIVCWSFWKTSEKGFSIIDFNNTFEYRILLRAVCRIFYGSFSSCLSIATFLALDLPSRSTHALKITTVGMREIS